MNQMLMWHLPFGIRLFGVLHFVSLDAYFEPIHKNVFYLLRNLEPKPKAEKRQSGNEQKTKITDIHRKRSLKVFASNQARIHII